MAYIRKIIAKEETLHGIARLHWIYILHGVLWFFILAGSGWLLNSAMTRLLVATASATGNVAFPSLFLNATGWLTFFLMAAGFFLFLLFVMKVLFTEVGLTERRVIHKTGMIFIKVHQIDIEEIRGDQIDLGWFGKFLGYGYIMLDCRFIGDIRLPAIENPERFIRGLHALRAGVQDSLSVVLGKGEKKPLHIIREEEQGGWKAGSAGPSDPSPQKPRPEIEPGKPGRQPEIEPPNVPPVPEIQPEPTPHAPPPSNPPQEPERPPPQPVQPIPAPAPSEPPLQPPSDRQGEHAVSAQEVTQIVRQETVHMAQQVVKELAEQGLLQKPPANDTPSGKPDIDNDLAAIFDSASEKKRGGGDHGMQGGMERIIH
ncbi:MAG: PH domain-containing protein [Micavibrio sp.]